MAKRSRRAKSLDSAIALAATPIFLMTERRIVVLFNHGCEELTGWPAETLIGRRCDYAGGDEDEAKVPAIAGELCPPPEVFQGQPVSMPAFLTHRDGRSLPRLIHFHPLRDNDGHVEHVLGVIAEINAARMLAAPSPAQQWHAELAAQRALLRGRFGLRTVVARNEQMYRALRQVRLAAGGKMPALFVGEEGVGKEHLARVTHVESEFRDFCFVPLDCRRLPAMELTQTLKRLFSNDPDDRRHDPPAHSSLRPGTLFLQHVDALPRDLQELLAREWSANEASPRLRLLAGTTTSLDQAVTDGTFRSDLHLLLTTQRIDLPPLRQRLDDLPLLAQAMLEECNRSAERPRGGFSDDVLRRFREYRWPGNLDELQAVIQEAWAACHGPVIQSTDLPFRFRTGMAAQEAGPAVPQRFQPLEQFLEAVERAQILTALERSRGNKSRAADLLGLPRPRLYRRMEALGIADAPGEEDPPGDTPPADHSG